MAERISIIVPVYNSEKVLERCLNSIITQDYKNIEIICINDGSGDKSLEICKMAAQKDDRVKVIDSQNFGVSAARNKGIDAAGGEYITFVDADDYVEHDIYTKLMKIAKTESVPMVFCNYTKRFPNGKSTGMNELNYIGGKQASSKEFIRHLLKTNHERLSGACWHVLFEQDVIKANGIRFDEELSMSEDFKFVLECLTRVKNCGICKDRLYNLTIADTSATGKYMEYQDVNMEAVNAWMLDCFLPELNDKSLKQDVLLNIAKTLQINIGNVCKPSSPLTFIERVNYIRRKRKIPVIRLAAKTAIKNRNYVDRRLFLEMVLFQFKLSLILALGHSLKYR